MFCPKCDKEVVLSENECPICGAPYVVYIPLEITQVKTVPVAPAGRGKKKQLNQGVKAQATPKED